MSRQLGWGGRHVGGHLLQELGIGIGGEQPLNQATGRGREVLPEWGQERLEFLLGRRLPQLAQAQLLDHGHDVLAEGGHGPGPAADPDWPWPARSTATVW